MPLLLAFKAEGTGLRKERGTHVGGGAEVATASQAAD
jgi:hypothetical protein